MSTRPSLSVRTHPTPIHNLDTHTNSPRNHKRGSWEPLIPIGAIVACMFVSVCICALFARARGVTSSTKLRVEVIQSNTVPVVTIPKNPDEQPLPGDTGVTNVVKCSTTQGELVFDVRRDWAPLGADRYIELVRSGFFTDLPFFRVAPKYITQFGVKYNHPWSTWKSIPDDPVRDDVIMQFGYLFFAGGGPNTRGDQMVIALCSVQGCQVTGLGRAPWERPIGNVRLTHTAPGPYGSPRDASQVLLEIEKSGFPYPKLEMPGLKEDAGGPDQGRIRKEERYLKEFYPDMEYFRSCAVTY